MTREQKNEYMRKWRVLNKDKIKENNKKYRTTHKEKIKEIHKIWRDTHREEINTRERKKYKENPLSYNLASAKYRATHKEQVKERNHKYKLNNRDKNSAYERKRRQEPLYKLKGNIRSLINISIKKKGYKKTNKVEEILGCSIEYFIEYLKKSFKEGMTIENHGKWHIDHIIPISSATTEEEVIKLNHYTNLQPLWAKENLQKWKKLM